MPGFLASLLPSLVSGVLGGLGGQKAPEAPIDAGVQSVMGNSQPAPMQENPTGGTGFKDLLNQGIKKGVETFIGAKIGNWKAGQAGAANREYLDSAFPELNPWEKAGATATNAGVGMSGQDVQTELQERELATRVAMQEQQLAFGLEQLSTQERMNQVSAAAGVQSAAIGAGPMNAQVAMLNALREAQATKTDTETTSILDANKRSWASDLATVLMSKYSANGAVASGDFRTDAMKALAAGSLAGGVNSLIKSGGLGKLGKWLSKTKAGQTANVSAKQSSPQVIE